MAKHFEKGNPGRPKGAVNKTTALLKDAILVAAQRAGDKAGGDGIASYLEQQAGDNPGPFLALLGKVLPLQIAGDKDNPLAVEMIQRKIVDPKS